MHPISNLFRILPINIIFLEYRNKINYKNATDRFCILQSIMSSCILNSCYIFTIIGLKFGILSTQSMFVDQINFKTLYLYEKSLQLPKSYLWNHVQLVWVERLVTLEISHLLLVYWIHKLCSNWFLLTIHNHLVGGKCDGTNVFIRIWLLFD